MGCLVHLVTQPLVAQWGCLPYTNGVICLRPLGLTPNCLKLTKTYRAYAYL